MRGVPPVLNLEREAALQRLLVDWAARGILRSAHDCAEGGLAVTLAECCFETDGIGADVDVAPATGDGGFDRLTATLFGESATRVVVSVPVGQTADVLAQAATAGVPAARIGSTGGPAVRISVGGETVIDCALKAAEERWATGLEAWLAGRAA